MPIVAVDIFFLLQQQLFPESSFSLFRVDYNIYRLFYVPIFTLKRGNAAMENAMKATIFFADGFEESEGLLTVDMFRRTRVQIDTISMNNDLQVHTSHQITLNADRLYSQIDTNKYDILILLGGKRGTQNLEACDALKDALKRHFESGKLMCGIYAAPSITGHLGLLKGRNYICFPELTANTEAAIRKSRQWKTAVW